MMPNRPQPVHERSTQTTPHGPIAWMVHNPVAANLFMVVVIVGGLLGLLESKQEIFPEFDLDRVVITVDYPGASPLEVEQGIVLAVEEVVQGLDGIKSVSSNAAEGQARISLELQRDVDGDRILNDVQSEVNRITTFPQESERPVVKRVVNKRHVIDLILSAHIPMADLQPVAERARQDLLRIPGITQVELSGLPDPEIHVEMHREQLESLGLTLNDVAIRIGQSSLERPAGTLKNQAGDTLIRVNERRRQGSKLKDLVIVEDTRGAAVRLGDIATIRDAYREDEEKAYYFNSTPALRLTAYRVGKETPTGVSDRVKAYAEQLRQTLPQTIHVDTWKDNSEILKGRIQLLLKNAGLGLILVLIILAVFLNLRLAAWVAVGIPFSFLGAFVLMPGADLSINMVTLFAFIVTLGLVVDDAIVVGENIYAQMQRGVPTTGAAITGTRQIATPVTFSILTTVAAFMPLFFVPGTLGKIFMLIPAIVVLVLLFSLLESFYVLPAHLAHTAGLDIQKLRQASRKGMGRALQRFTLGYYRPILLFSLRHRWSVITFSMVLLALSIALVKSGTVPFNFFPKVEDDDVRASMRLAHDAPYNQTLAMQKKLEHAARKAAEHLGDPSLIDGMFTRVGEAVRTGGHGSPRPSSGSHLVAMELHLKDIAKTGVSASQFATAWRQAMTPLPPEIEGLSFHYNIGPGAGADVDVELSHPDLRMLEQAAQQLEQHMRRMDQLVNVESGFSVGKPQLDFTLTPLATNYGITANDVANQLRDAIYGAEAVREQRNRHEMRIMVRFPSHQRRNELDLKKLLIHTPQGEMVPLPHVATFKRSTAPTTIVREGSIRVINVSGELAPGVRDPRKAMKQLNSNIIPALKAAFPALKSRYVGAKRENDDTFTVLRHYYLLALVVIYALLAIPFASYRQPLIIMSVIPMGFVGAVAGHMVMDYGMSLVSILGIIALSGVVVNDSLILIHGANRARDTGLTPYKAVIHAGISRLRPILLTSLTTFVGLAPMIFETSVQARFLIPMALSLGFGVLFATFVVLILVPVLYLLLTPRSCE
ncbi:efflux RND transporter permease subunit [Magnetococcus sp. PR-3]|uniref:efflux RND transporter permease subunit n=1 Tax=Magnetococcus sp. PR-3 TaxID=3120355 RepID=UPI002FCE1536